MEKKKIMVVDDEEAIGQIVKLILEESGEYIVKSLTMGSTAVSVASEFRPNLIFLDMMMPDMDGSDVFNALRENKNTKDIPVVFMTAMATDEEMNNNVGIVGGHPLLAKPATTEKLIKCIKKYAS